MQHIQEIRTVELKNFDKSSDQQMPEMSSNTALNNLNPPSLEATYFRKLPILLVRLVRRQELYYKATP